MTSQWICISAETKFIYQVSGDTYLHWLVMVMLQFLLSRHWALWVIFWSVLVLYLLILVWLGRFRSVLASIDGNRFKFKIKLNGICSEQKFILALCLSPWNFGVHNYMLKKILPAYTYTIFVMLVDIATYYFYLLRCSHKYTCLCM